MRSDTNVTPHVLESFQWTDDNATSLGSLYRTALKLRLLPMQRGAAKPLQPLLPVQGAGCVACLALLFPLG